ncbi:MAG: ornithine carbamoyltransferase [Firmicutes bacterium]|nr:ornithine carbamoyltransferase [Bacillota bacterium]
MKDWLSLKDVPASEIRAVLELAREVKGAPERYASALAGRNLLMLFQKTSTRTRLSFELGIQELGGRAVVMDWSKSNFAISPIRYEARYVSRHAHAIMARLLRHADVQELARWAHVPVINGCCERYHPTQALADLLTVYERCGTFDGVTIAYVGVHNNVANCLTAGATKVGARVILITPEVNPSSWDEELMRAARETGRLEVTLDPHAVRRADFVYTDTWVDMEHFNDPAYADEKARRMNRMMPYQLNRELLDGHRPFIMHDMPIHPGLEIAEDLIECDHSLIYEQAENRLHAEKALLLRLLGAA